MIETEEMAGGAGWASAVQVSCTLYLRCMRTFINYDSIK